QIHCGKILRRKMLSKLNNRYRKYLAITERWIQMQNMQKVDIDILKEHPRNSEFFDDITGKEWEDFKQTILEEGIITEIIVAPDMTIVSGHQRYRAAKELGMEYVPIKICSDLTDENKKLKVLLASNFSRSTNAKAKKRKIIAEYAELCGYKHGGDRKSSCQNGDSKESLADMAAKFNTSKRTIERSIAIEHKLIPEIKELVDNKLITETAATNHITPLSEEQQRNLILNLDVTKKYMEKEIAEKTKSLKKAKDYFLKNNNELREKNMALSEKVDRLSEACKIDPEEYHAEKAKNEKIQQELKDANETVKQELERAKEKIEDLKQWNADAEERNRELVEDKKDLENKLGKKQAFCALEERNKLLVDAVSVFSHDVDFLMTNSRSRCDFVIKNIDVLLKADREDFECSLEMMNNWTTNLLQRIKEQKENTVVQEQEKNIA
ncbi:MAG: ParB N-terminal domain-containing protein, partial [Clostridiales bacterium]|nr:ParB N-terminal domain-containing protein [Clostridiales bacterium]